MEPRDIGPPTTRPTATASGSDAPARTDSRSTRRTLLGAAALGTAALAGSARLPRITFAQDATPAPVSGGTQVVPGQVQYPSGRDGVPDAFLALPEPFVSSAGVPGKGGSVTVFTLAYDPPPPARESNQFWQELERRLGVTWEVDMTPQASYGEKSAAYFAGGDLPDIFYINPGQGANQQLQAMDQGAFQDLTTFVTGDALQQFPNLSKIPAYVWENVKFQGKILGIPATHVARFGNVPFIRQDWAETVGIPDARGPEQARQLMAAFTQNDPNGNGSPDTWGMGRFEGGWLPWDNTVGTTHFRVPFDWRLNPDGTLSFMAETDEYRQMIEFQRAVYADGSYHPDAATMTFASAREAFIAGATGLHTGGFLAFFLSGGLVDQVSQVTPGGLIRPWFPVAADGGPGTVRNTPGYFGYNGIPASVTDEERVLELLHILDYLASPFGSEEWLFLSYGIEGVHYTRDATGSPILNDLGRAERSSMIYLMPPLPTFYFPDRPELALSVMDDAVRLFDMGIDPPTRGLYSPADVEMGPALAQFGSDSINALVTGRTSMDEFDSIVAEWRDRGGDQVREELQEALQQRG